MTTSTRSIAAAREGASTIVPRGLDDLLFASAGTLRGLYESASTPAVADLAGDLRGRMLAPVAIPSWLFWWARLWAATSLFPWRGKSFVTNAGDVAHGTGINRVFTDRIRWFPFTTSIGPSRAGKFEAFQLDYDHPGNPRLIRAIKDEVRQLRPGLFLGQAYLSTRRREVLVLYFGLERAD